MNLCSPILYFILKTESHFYEIFFQTLFEDYCIIIVPPSILRRALGIQHVEEIALHIGIG